MSDATAWLIVDLAPVALFVGFGVFALLVSRLRPLDELLNEGKEAI